MLRLRHRGSMAFRIALAAALLLCMLTPGSSAFCLPSCSSDKRDYHGYRLSFRPKMLLSQLNDDDDEDDGNYDDKNNDDDIDGETRFYRDLEEAKKAKLGASIPKKQLEESASRAQEEFLQAMKEASQEFKEAKEELGSEGAIDLFLNRIRKEDEKRESGINDDDVCDDDLLGEFE